MTKSDSIRTWAVALGALTLAMSLAAPAGAQGWRTPVGSARAVAVTSGGTTTLVAATEVPTGGGAGRAEQNSVADGLVVAGATNAVSSGDMSIERLGVQSVATATDVAILGGRVSATKVIAIATLSDLGKSSTVDADGSEFQGLTVDGVAMSDVAPNTRVDLPGAGYVILNEQSTGRGRGVGITVNMIRVVLTNGDEVIVGSVTSANSQ